MTPNIYVVIVTYNGTKWVEPCFSSLRRSTVALKTIVIDNGSTDDTVARIASEFPEVTVVETGKNLGFGKANNVGMELAYQQGADYVFLLNQDAWIDPDAVEKIVAAHVQHPEYGILSPMHLNGAGDGLDYGFSCYVAPNKCTDLYSDIYLGRTKTIYDVGFVNAAAWMLTRACMEKVGGFSPSFFHYGEDDNYTQRLRFHGLKLGVLPASRIYHDRAQRKLSTIYFNDDETFRRELIARSSNPNQNFSFAKEAVSIYAHLLYALARGNIDDVKFQLRKIKLMGAIDKKAIISNRETSKQGKAAFMNLGSRQAPG